MQHPFFDFLFVEGKSFLIYFLFFFIFLFFIFFSFDVCSFRLKDDPVADCIEAAKLHNCQVIKTDKHELNIMAGQRPHNVNIPYD